jgi:hypothetical protein
MLEPRGQLDWGLLELQVLDQREQLALQEAPEELLAQLARQEQLV